MSFTYLLVQALEGAPARGDSFIAGIRSTRPSNWQGLPHIAGWGQISVYETFYTMKVAPQHQ
jgi:hypothetical protein